MPRVQCTCLQCETHFEVYPSILKSGGGKYCSRECLEKSQNHSISCTCLYCGTQFQLSPSKIAEGKGLYCSKQCNYLDHRGANNKNWRGGSFYRGGDWNQQRKLARERDGGICQVCKRSPKEGERHFDVHHIKPMRDFNGDLKAANRLDNLITLCQSCHPRVERGVISAIQRRLF